MHASFKSRHGNLVSRQSRLKSDRYGSNGGQVEYSAGNTRVRMSRPVKLLFYAAGLFSFHSVHAFMQASLFALM